MAQTATESLDNFVTTDGVVYAITETNSILYFGGYFSNVYRKSGGGVPVSTDTGNVDVVHARINGSVSASIPDGQGGCFVGGSFTRVGGYPRTNLVHIRSDRSVDPNWSPDAVGGSVGAFALSGGTLFVGGTFTNVNGQVRNRLAAIDTTTGQLLDWNPNANGTVYAMAIHGTNVYVAGSFTTVGGQTRNNLVALSATTGAATSWNPQPSDTVEDMVLSGNRLFIGGRFGGVGAQTRTRLASFDLTTGTLDAWIPSIGTITIVQATVFALAVSQNTVFVGGVFSTVNGTNRVNLAAIDADTGVLKSWNAQADYGFSGSVPAAQVNTLLVHNDLLYVGGSLLNIGGQSRLFSAALTLDTATATPWNPNPNMVAITFAPITNGIFMGGIFSGIGGIGRTNLAAFNLSTSEITSWNPTTSTNVWALQVYGDRMYLGGEFKTVNGITRSNLASVDLAAGTLSSWAPNPNIYVMALTTWGDRLYAGGGFTNVFGVGRTNLAEFDLNTGNLTSWDPVLNRAAVRTLAVQENTLYAGGLISTVLGQTRRRVAAFELSSGTPVLSSWDPGITTTASVVECVLPVQDKVYISGRFTSVGGLPRTNLVCVDAVTAQVQPFTTSSDQPITSIVVVSNILYAGGDFNVIGGNSRLYLAALDATTGQVLSWKPNPNSFVRKLLLARETLFVGGFFYSTQPGRSIAAYPLLTGMPAIGPDSLVRLPEGPVQFDVSAAGAAQATVFVSTDLGLWEPLFTVPLTNGMATFRDNEAALHPRRFYKIAVP